MVTLDRANTLTILFGLPTFFTRHLAATQNDALIAVVLVTTLALPATSWGFGALSHKPESGKAPSACASLGIEGNHHIFWGVIDNSLSVSSLGFMASPTSYDVPETFAELRV